MHSFCLKHCLESYFLHVAICGSETYCGQTDVQFHTTFLSDLFEGRQPQAQNRIKPQQPAGTLTLPQVSPNQGVHGEGAWMSDWVILACLTALMPHHIIPSFVLL